MTTFEHAMLGATLALAVGSQRREGWGVAAAAGVAGAFPDWDGLSIFLGSSAYVKVHRAWGHNLLAAGLTGVLVGGLGYLLHLSVRVRRATVRLWSKTPEQLDAIVPKTFSTASLVLWQLVCLAAVFIHLPADVLYSGHPTQASYPVKLLWPFSEEGWVFPLVPWGDVVASLILVAEMFALYFWPKRGQSIALLTLAAVLGYLVVRFFLRN